MDPKVGATIFTLLLYVLSSHSPQSPPQDHPAINEETPISQHVGQGGVKPGHDDRTNEQSPGKNNPGSAPAEFPPGSTLWTREEANLRSGPGTAYKRIGKLHKGAKVFALTTHGSWHQVKLINGQIGWVSASLVSPSANGSKPGGMTQEDKTPPEGTNGKPEIIAYFAQNHAGDTAPIISLGHAKSILDGVVMFSYFLDENGNLISSNNDQVVRQLRSNGIETYALIHNYRSSQFDQGVAHSVLRSEELRLKAIRNIMDILEQGHFDGINVDLENVHPGDRSYYTRFIQELSTVLRPRGKKVTISVPAKSRDLPGTAWFGAFDYYSLGKIADKVMIMAYDEHSPVSGPGPVASINWVREVIRYAMTQMPKSKIYLGIPAYGYDWPLYWGGSVEAVSYRQAVSRAARSGVEPQWDESSASCYYRYSIPAGQHEVWFENGTSLAAKVRLVKQYGLAGIAVWRLGYEEKEFWQIINQELRR
ncbi:MAG: SH3 domain-containing protein [Firmicutes bacterium]|nr:SH3 domain-containing protein [Bacillota bacterium]